VLIAASREEAALLDTLGTKLGTLPRAIDAILDQAGAAIVVVRVEEGATDAATTTNIIGGTVGGNPTGVQALVAAEPSIGFTPKILLAPGFTSHKAVADELLSIAARLAAIVIIDGTDTTDADAIAYREDFDNSRGYLVDPAVTIRDDDGADIVVPASPFVAGLIVQTDNDRGFWWSPSNKVILGVTGTARKIDFLLGDENSRANLLNENDINTIIRESGFRLWGNRTLASVDRKYTFLPVRRTADLINESIKRASLVFVDQPLSRPLVESITDTVNEYLRSLIAQGAILGGECWFDQAANPEGELMQGKIRFRYKFQPPTPAEHLIYESSVVTEYFDVLFSGSN
jgi:phage tail sheath protein FI